MTVHVEMGVAFYGPFTFSDKYQPVSPILCFYTQEDVTFNHPVKFKIPHVVMNSEGINLYFAMAKHHTDNDALSFQRIEHRPTTEYCSGENPFGMLSSNQCCYLCIVAKKETSMPVSKGYYFHVLTKKGKNKFTCEIKVVCTFFLQACITVSM